MTEPMLRVSFGAASDTGRVRSANEDSYLITPPVFLVADGMGGHARGDLASQAVANSFTSLGGSRWVAGEAILEAVQQATASIDRLAEGGRPPGSTVSGVGLSNQSGMPCWLVFNVGDSRTYLLREGALTQVSVDHSSTRAGANGVAPRNVITRALGAGLASPVVDQWLIPAQAGDRVMICSDGLTNEVTPELMAATLLTEPEPQAAAGSLVASALNAGGRDNVTVVVVDCEAVVSTAVATGGLDTTASDTVKEEES